MKSLVRRVIVGMHLAWIMCLLICWISGCATTPMQRTSSLTTPESFLGYKVGADYKLTTYEKAMEYFELLAGQTDRMEVVDVGPTSMGKRHKYAIISSTKNMKDLEHYRQIAEKLSRARGVSPDQAQQLAQEGKAVAWIDAGLHASECAPSEHLIQLAYDLVADEDELFT